MVTATHLAGITTTLVSCIALAVQNLLIRKGTDSGRAYDAVFVVMVTNVVVLGPYVVWQLGFDFVLTPRSIAAFVGAGLVGTMLGRAFKYVSIGRIGASRTEPIVMANAVVATILGSVILDEVITPVHWLSIVGIVFGIGVISWETTRENPHNLSKRDLALGLVLPIGAAVAYGVEPIFATRGLNEGTPPSLGVLLKTLAALGGFLVYLGWENAMPPLEAARSGSTRLFVLAGLGNTVFILGYYTALTMAPVSVIVPILPTSTLFTVLLSAAFMPQRLEHVTSRLVSAAVIVVAGVVLLTVST